MASEIFENAQSFEKHISFANQIKELLWKTM
jgi:hypothetical protein